MEKDTRTEFEKMEAGEMFWNSDAKIGELKKHARRLADRFNATTEDEDQLPLSLLKELFGDCDDDIFIKPPFHCDYGFHIHVGTTDLSLHRQSSNGFQNQDSKLCKRPAHHHR